MITWAFLNTRAVVDTVSSTVSRQSRIFDCRQKTAQIMLRGSTVDREVSVATTEPIKYRLSVIGFGQISAIVLSAKSNRYAIPDQNTCVAALVKVSICLQKLTYIVYLLMRDRKGN